MQYEDMGSVTCLGQAENGEIPSGCCITLDIGFRKRTTATYGGLIPAPTWRSIILPAVYRETPNSEPWTSVSPYSCPQRDTLTMQRIIGLQRNRTCSPLGALPESRGVERCEVTLV
jgi:hypothetical protein